MLEAPAASSRRDEDCGDADERQGENFTLQTGESVLLSPSLSFVIRCSVRNPLMVAKSEWILMLFVVPYCYCLLFDRDSRFAIYFVTSLIL